MLQLALMALLLGAPAFDGPDRDRTGEQAAQTEATTAVEVPTSDTFAFGTPSVQSPIKLWAAFGYGVTDRFFDGNGNSQDLPFEATSQRVHVGAQINFLNTPNFQVGVGGQLNIASNSMSTQAGDMGSGFGIQGVKAFLSARGQTLGVHGGYFFDMGSRDTDTGVANSVMQNAIFAGASFDYKPSTLRLFAGVDYYLMQENADENIMDGNDLVFWKLGAGLDFGLLELGVAAQIRSQLTRTPTSGLTGAGGGHHGSIIPYLNISPAGLPASLFVRGGVTDQFGEYGLALGGRNDLRSAWGFTAGLTVGFD